MNEGSLGRHLLADFHEVVSDCLSDAAWLEALLREAAAAAEATPITANLHHFGVGLGVTGVLLLKESHISIHTWPEHRFAAIDVFMCGHCRPERAIEVLRDAMRPAEVVLHDAVRGRLGSARPAP